MTYKIHCASVGTRSRVEVDDTNICRKMIEKTKRRVEILFGSREYIISYIKRLNVTRTRRAWCKILIISNAENATGQVGNAQKYNIILLL